MTVRFWGIAGLLHTEADPLITGSVDLRTDPHPDIQVPFPASHLQPFVHRAER